MDGTRTMLLAEDNPRDVELTLAALEEAHLAGSTFVVSDGAELLDYLYLAGKFAGREPGNPSVILLDLKMPKIDGLEVLRRIKEDQRLRSTPVVILTSSREERDVVESYQLGANAYVVKPVDFDHFVEAVVQLASFWTSVNEPPPAPLPSPAP